MFGCTQRDFASICGYLLFALPPQLRWLFDGQYSSLLRPNCALGCGTGLPAFLGRFAYQLPPIRLGASIARWFHSRYSVLSDRSWLVTVRPDFTKSAASHTAAPAEGRTSGPQLSREREGQPESEGWPRYRWARSAAGKPAPVESLSESGPIPTPATSAASFFTASFAIVERLILPNLLPQCWATTDKRHVQYCDHCENGAARNWVDSSQPDQVAGVVVRRHI